jgi:hypothetical protein
VSPAASGERISTRRKWAAIGAATALLAGSFWLVLLAFDMWLGDLTVAELEGGAEVPMTRAVGLALGGAFAVLGASFVALAFISRRARPWRGAAVAWLLGGALWILLPFLAGEPYTPMVAGAAAGGLVALRAEPEHTMGRRVVAALAITVYVYLLLRITLLPGVIVAPLLPLPVLAWADALSDRRALGRTAGEPAAKPARRPGR